MGDSVPQGPPQGTLSPVSPLAYGTGGSAPVCPRPPAQGALPPVSPPAYGI